jgi:MerR family transcriptional regulator, Zn(II)-responsive regulator of zntA
MRIGELAERTGVSTKALRFYEEQGILPAPSRTSAGYRDYAPTAVDRVGFVRNAQTAGLTLAQIRQVLAVRDDGQAPCRHVAGFVDERLAQVDQRLEELTATRRQLQALRRRVQRLEPTDCAPDEICSAMAVGHAGT